LSENQNDTFQAVEFVDPARIGFKSSASFRFPKFELVESSLDGFAVIWCPAPDAAQEFVVALRFNFVSTDFTFLKGANNIAVRLCVKTEVLEFFPLYSAPSMGAEICYGKLQLLREHGAARKQTDDLARTMKKVEDMKRKIATINSQAETSSEVLTVREHRRCEAKSAGLYSNRRAFGDMQESKLQSLLACSQSSRSITYLDLRGEPLDDPDARPFPFSNNGIYGRLHQSWQTSSSRHDLPRASATTVRDAHSRSSSKERSLSDRVTEPG
jgi:hypothetical protein